MKRIIAAVLLWKLRLKSIWVMVMELLSLEPLEIRLSLQRSSRLVWVALASSLKASKTSSTNFQQGRQQSSLKPLRYLWPDVLASIYLINREVFPSRLKMFQRLLLKMQGRLQQWEANPVCSSLWGLSKYPNLQSPLMPMRPHHHHQLNSFKFNTAGSSPANLTGSLSMIKYQSQNIKTTNQ